MLLAVGRHGTQPELMFGVRVKLELIPTAGGTRLRARGVRLALTSFGSGPSKVSQSPQPATLTFHAVGFDRIRRQNVQKEAKVGSLDGEIRRGADQRPVFRVSLPPEEALTLEQPLEPLPQGGEGRETASKTRRALEIAFDASTFEGKVEGMLLVLPDEVIEGCAYLELRVELVVAGAEEAARTANDTLDTPITLDAPIPLVPRQFRVAVADHQGNPLANEAYEIELDGTVVNGTTDGDGNTLFHSTQTDVGVLRIAGLQYDLRFVDEEADDVREFQAILNALGFRAGELTGTMNRVTEDAVLAFQQQNGVPATGELDAGTKQRLRERYVRGDIKKGAA